MSRGGKIARLSIRAARETKGSGEADPVGVDLGVLGGFEHHGADRVVAADVPPDLLADQFWRL